MGNKDHYIQFNPDNRVFWASHTDLSALDDKDLEATYQRARKFFTVRIKTLIKEHKWRELDLGSKQVTIFLSLSEDGYINRFSLPATFSSFLDPDHFSDWRMQFEMGVFEAGRPNISENELYIAGPTVLADIFYLFQSIAPGMLVIAGRIGKLEDMGEMEWVRALPRESWIIEHAQILQYILGSADTYEALLHASRDQDKAFTVSWVSPWDEDDSDCRSTGSREDDDDWDTDYEWPPHLQARNATALTCTSECGGCSRCDFDH